MTNTMIAALTADDIIAAISEYAKKAGHATSDQTKVFIKTADNKPVPDKIWAEVITQIAPSPTPTTP